MRLYLDCIPCFQRQALFATKDENEEKRAKILKKVMDLLLKTSWNITPDEIANSVHNIIRKEMGVNDPYQEIKKVSNEKALKLYPKLKKGVQKVNDSRERLLTAAKLSIAGNIIDFGPAFDFNLEETIEEVLKKKLAVDNFNILFQKVKSANKLLYFADNAGEIVFDKLFIEEIINIRKRPFELISFVVKGGPIINDAMLEDVYEVGLDNIPNIVFKCLGNGEKNTGPNRRDNEVKEWIKNHDLVISKGQGNFEGLSENVGVLFMLMAKCPVIAKELGVNVKDTVIKLS